MVVGLDRIGTAFWDGCGRWRSALCETARMFIREGGILWLAPRIEREDMQGSCRKLWMSRRVCLDGWDAVRWSWRGEAGTGIGGELELIVKGALVLNRDMIR
jgi:hypothetical protein